MPTQELVRDGSEWINFSEHSIRLRVVRISDGRVDFEVETPPECLLVLLEGQRFATQSPSSDQ